MVYLAKLLVVMTDRVKIVRIHARNVHRKRTQTPRRRRVSRISLSRSRKATVSHADAPGCHLRTTCACLAVASEEESCRDTVTMSSSL